MRFRRAFTSLRELLAFDNGVELVVQRLLFRGDRLQVHRLRGCEMIVDHRGADAGSIRGCVAGDMYVTLLGKAPGFAPKVVLDIGANVGGFVMMLAGIYGMDAIERLVCVELNPNTYERLRFNVKVNFGDRSEVLLAGVCAQKREIRVRLGHGSTSDSIYRSTRMPGASSERAIQGMSLDDVVAAHIPQGVIDVCKIDVEGAEDEILTGESSENRSLDRVRHLLVEIHPAERSEAIVRTLEARGFVRLGGGNGTAMCGVHLFRNDKLEGARA